MRHLWILPLLVLLCLALSACGSSSGPAPDPLSWLVINEVDADQPASDDFEFVEIYNAGVEPVPLADLILVHINGSDSTEFWRVDLSQAGTSLAPGDYLVVGDANVLAALPTGVAGLALPDMGPSSLQNGPDGLAIFDTSSASVVDALSYGGAITDAVITGFAGTYTLVEGTATTLAESSSDPDSLARTPNGTDTDSAAGDWMLSMSPTPGASN